MTTPTVVVFLLVAVVDLAVVVFLVVAFLVEAVFLVNVVLASTFSVVLSEFAVAFFLLLI